MQRLRDIGGDRGMRALLVCTLWAAGLGSLATMPAAAANPASSICSERLGATSAAWVLADFDGDQKPDLAVADLPTRSDAGVLRRITIVSGAPDGIPLCSGVAAESLRARDLDGDSDRDLVLVSPASGPIAVWLNDGTGHFEPGDIEAYRYQLSHDDPRSFDSVPGAAARSDTVDHSRSEAGVVVCAFDTSLVATDLLAGCGHNRPASLLFHIRARGPPVSF